MADQDGWSSATQGIISLSADRRRRTVFEGAVCCALGAHSDAGQESGDR